MQPTCNVCASELSLEFREAGEYVWRCSRGCAPDVTTGIPATESIKCFQKTAIWDGRFDFSVVTRPLKSDSLAGAKVYMPQVLHHFIDCTWGGCYNSIYINFLVPHLDCPDVVDYVLRSPVIHDGPNVIRSSGGARIYGELLRRLHGVASARIKAYLDATFCRTANQPLTNRSTEIEPTWNRNTLGL